MPYWYLTFLIVSPRCPANRPVCILSLFLSDLACISSSAEMKFLKLFLYWLCQLGYLQYQLLHYVVSGTERFNRSRPIYLFMSLLFPYLIKKKIITRVQVHVVGNVFSHVLSSQSMFVCLSVSVRSGHNFLHVTTLQQELHLNMWTYLHYTVIEHCHWIKAMGENMILHQFLLVHAGVCLILIG